MTSLYWICMKREKTSQIRIWTVFFNSKLGQEVGGKTPSDFIITNKVSLIVLYLVNMILVSKPVGHYTKEFGI